MVEEALRYLGAGDAPEDLRRQVAVEAKALSASLRPRFAYRVCELDFQSERILLRGTAVVLTGTTAFRMLGGCGRAACGSALVEQGCDGAEKELAARFPGQYLTDRFSPGYGDLPLSLQGNICTALDAPRRLGLHVTESSLLNPVKSVTAVVGLSDQPQKARIRGCTYCQMRESCALHKGGNHCEN